ncbi:MAG TPA: nucleotide exchange factor GrpE [Candidatus Pacebacteria bacterium]|nr:nucleotide exchange factor GrpE [Candidatus Paceibacterota bacterium]
MSEKKDICEEVENLKVSIKLVLHDPKTNKFLLLKRKDGKKTWGFAGGTVNGDENISNTLVREVEEEIGDGVKYSVNGIVHAKRRAAQSGCGEYIKIAYLATYEDGEITLSEEHTKYEWVDAERVKKGKHTSWVKETIQKALEKIESIESVERLHRCLADFDNYKKRQIEQQKEFTKYASEGVISDMLPVLDNFHAATGHIPDGEADNPWVTGIMFIQQQMEKVFEEHDVTKIEVSVGDEFNPNIMEAVKNNDEKLDEHATVEKIAQHGYKIGEKVLRPARVVLK